MRAAKGMSDLCFRKFAGFGTRSVTLEIVRAARKCHEDDTWRCRSRKCISAKFRVDNHPAHRRVEGPRFEQRIRAVSSLVPNALSHRELWQDKCHMGDAFERSSRILAGSREGKTVKFTLPGPKCHDSR
jgi:hypothetical protein